MIEPADPSTVYVPSYDPAIVYGAPAYPYPTVTYPGYVAGGALTFGTGLALGAAWGGGWGTMRLEQRDVNINVNNKYVKQLQQEEQHQSANKNWQHNPQHRGNAPYGNKELPTNMVEQPEGQAVRAAQVVQVASESRWCGWRWWCWQKPGGPGGPGAPVESESPVVLAVRVVPESPVVRAARWCWKARVVPVAPENPVVPVGPEPEQKLAVAEPALSRPRSGGGGGANSIGGHQPSKGGGGGGGGGAFSGGSGSSAKAASSRGGSSMKGGGGGGRRRRRRSKRRRQRRRRRTPDAKRDERKNIETKNYELIKTSVPCVCADGFEFSLCRLNSGAADQNRCRCSFGFETKAIQHAERGG